MAQLIPSWVHAAYLEVVLQEWHQAGHHEVWCVHLVHAWVRRLHQHLQQHPKANVIPQEQTPHSQRDMPGCVVAINAVLTAHITRPGCGRCQAPIQLRCNLLYCTQLRLRCNSLSCRVSAGSQVQKLAAVCQVLVSGSTANKLLLHAPAGLWPGPALHWPG